MNSHESSPLLETADGEHEIEVHFSKAKKKANCQKNRARDREVLRDKRAVSDAMNRSAVPSGDFRPALKSNEAHNDKNNGKISNNEHNSNSKNKHSDSDATFRPDASHSYSEIIVNLSIESLEEVSEVSCLFVASFDARRGNLIEWRLPTDFNLDGVEFKAIPSGSHTVSRDYVLFKHGSHFGVAAFASQAVAEGGNTVKGGDGQERGIRSRSVGVLCPTYANISSHLRFLESAVQALLDVPHAFGELVAYFERYRMQHMPATSPFGYGALADGARGRNSTSTDEDSLAAARHRGRETGLAALSNSDSLLVISSSSHYSAASRDSYLKDLYVHDSEASFYEFVRLFGVRVFALWRLAMLRRRVLFYCPPPVGATCYHVYWCAALANRAGPGPLPGAANPLFLVTLLDAARIADEQRRLVAVGSGRTPTQTPTHNLRRQTQSGAADMPTPTRDARTRSADAALAACAAPMFSGPAWIACTSDRLYEAKTNLYDALVCAPGSGPRRSEVLRVTDERLRCAAAVGRADRVRMRKLVQLAALAETREARDAALRAYFTHLNTELLNTLQRTSMRNNAEARTLSTAELRALQLEPNDPTDRHFLVELIETLELEVTVAFEPPSLFAATLCPCCRDSPVE